MLDKGTKAEVVQAINAQYRFGPLVYVIAFDLAFVSATASLLLCLGQAVFFVLPANRTVPGT